MPNLLARALPLVEIRFVQSLALQYESLAVNRVQRPQRARA